MSAQDWRLHEGILKPKPAHFAELIDRNGGRFARDGFEGYAAQRLHVYHEQAGTYLPNGDEMVAKLVKRILKVNHREDQWSSRLSSETTEYLRVDAPQLWERPPLDTLNLKNGLLDVKTRELRPHSPDFLSATQLPVAYDSDASCPAWERQVKDTFPSDALDLAWSIVAWLMLPITSLQKALLLLGEGGCGKSAFIAALVAFLGVGNVSNVTLQKIAGDRFSTSMIVGKLANLFADIPSEALDTCGTFKAITGGDRISGEYKFRSAFSFLPFSRLIFSVNQPPIAKDADNAFFERWLVIPFDHKYRGQADEKDRAALDAELATPSELSGVLNRALDALDAGLIANGLPEPASCLRALEQFRMVTDPFSVWISTKTVVSPGARAAKFQLLANYNAWAARHGHQPMTEKALTQNLRRHVPEIREARLSDERRSPCWIGIGIAVGAQNVAA